MKAVASYLSVAFAMILCFAQQVFAFQVPFAAIKGKVTDPSDAVLGDASLIIRDKHTGSQRTATTDRDGMYRVERLDPGDYELQISRPDFATTLYGLSLRAGDYLTVNVQLALGQLTESIAVNGQASGINISDFQVNSGVG